MRTQGKLLTLFLIALAVTVGCLLGACGTTQHGEEGVNLEEVQAYVALFPACPALPDDPVAAKEITLAWLTTLKEIAGSLPAGLHIELIATINRNVSGEVAASAEIESAIEAILEGLK